MQDQGIGMSEQEVENLFTPFFRSKNEESLKANPYGNGLGLSICQNIAKGLLGSLTVKSELGVGSVFCLEFPAQRHSRKNRQANVSREEKGGNMAQELEQLLDYDSQDETINKSVKQNSMLQATDLDTVDFTEDAAAKESAPKIVVADDQ